MSLETLRGPITHSTMTEKKAGPSIKQSKTIFPLLEMNFVTHLSLANNHIWDFGERGFSDTTQALQNLGISYAGAGVDIDAIYEPIKRENSN